MLPTRYRIEHYQPGKTRVLAIVVDIRPHRCGLDVFVSQLLNQGQRGWLRLVDETTGQVVAKRRIKAPSSPRRERQSPQSG